ncbi:hypothetical protein D9757_005532 [Collybiopsis confluens]|uniref:Uncharacterized protein n=1 Tax=Collybiopsis confluens TaxID=2823264 RepID=A0A8H5HLQ8_9AGAR|nr:hypothetical protein D9757_005532 [Collybiopsis confluens]
MGRWTQYDEDDYRLPAGFKRVAYDADTGQYAYQDSGGNEWVGAPYAQYGSLRPTGGTISPSSEFLEGPWTTLTKEMASESLDITGSNPMHPLRPFQTPGGRLIRRTKELAKRIRSKSVSAKKPPATKTEILQPTPPPAVRKAYSLRVPPPSERQNQTLDNKLSKPKKAVAESEPASQDARPYSIRTSKTVSHSSKPHRHHHHHHHSRSVSEQMIRSTTMPESPVSSRKSASHEKSASSPAPVMTMSRTMEFAISSSVASPPSLSDSKPVSRFVSANHATKDTPSDDKITEGRRRRRERERSEEKETENQERRRQREGDGQTGMEQRKGRDRGGRLKAERGPKEAEKTKEERKKAPEDRKQFSQEKKHR